MYTHTIYDCISFICHPIDECKDESYTTGKYSSKRCHPLLKNKRLSFSPSCKEQTTLKVHIHCTCYMRRCRLKGNIPNLIS